MKFFYFLLLSFSLISKTQSQTLINPYFWGQNYWVPSSADPFLSKAAEGGVTLMRYGGIGPNVSTPVLIGDILTFIEKARSEGIEPIIQIPYQPNEVEGTWPNPKAYWIANARQLVYETNVNQKKNVKYWIIANEPDQSIPNGYGFTASNPSTSQNIADYIKPISDVLFLFKY